MFVFSALTVFLLLTGCVSPPTAGSAQAFPPSGGAPSEEWCLAGSYWKWRGATEQGLSAAALRIVGKEMFKGKEMCHVVYEASGEGVVAGRLHYYYSKGEDEIYYVLEDEQGNTVYEMSIGGSSDGAGR
jgi:hypothetical protein